MSTREPQPRLSAVKSWTALVVGAVAVLIVWALFVAADQPDTAAGALVGGFSILVLFGIVVWRARRRPEATGTTGRTLTGTADERDRRILDGSFVAVGVTAIVAVVAAGVAVTLGADAKAALFIVEIVLFAVFVGAFVVLSRRL